MKVRIKYHFGTEETQNVYAAAVEICLIQRFGWSTNVKVMGDRKLKIETLHEKARELMDKYSYKNFGRMGYDCIRNRCLEHQYAISDQTTITKEFREANFVWGVYAYLLLSEYKYKADDLYKLNDYVNAYIESKNLKKWMPFGKPRKGLNSMFDDSRETGLQNLRIGGKIVGYTE